MFWGLSAREVFYGWDLGEVRGGGSGVALVGGCRGSAIRFSDMRAASILIIKSDDELLSSMRFIFGRKPSVNL